VIWLQDVVHLYGPLSAVLEQECAIGKKAAVEADKTNLYVKNAIVEATIIERESIEADVVIMEPLIRYFVGRCVC